MAAAVINTAPVASRNVGRERDSQQVPGRLTRLKLFYWRGSAIDRYVSLP